MKLIKTMAIMGTTALAVGGTVFLMSNAKARNKAGKAVLKAMNCAEDEIKKVMK